jgi:hypothetical protein
VIGWAVFGFLCTVLAAWVYVRWFTSGDARAVGVGPDPLSSSTRFWVDVFQVISPLLAVLAVVHAVRSSRRQGRLSLDAMLVIGWSISWWHDPLINWLRPSVFYNAAFFNRGSWSAQIPGWISPNARFLPQPVLGIGAVYVWLGLAFGMLATGVMRWARRRWPTVGPLGIVVTAFIVVFVAEFLLELLVVRTQLVAYPSAIRGLTLWAGTTHQMPVYEQVLWSGVLTFTGALRFFVDPRGRSFVERGADRLQIGARLRTTLRLFAVIGAVHAAAFSYDIAVNAAGLYAGSVAQYPSYLRTQQCGPGTDILCPGPRAPIVLNRQSSGAH